MKRVSNIIISVILSIGMVTASLPVELLAQEAEKTHGTEELHNETENNELEEVSDKMLYEVVSFDELPEEVIKQNVAVGTSLDSLQLPDTLAVSYRALTESPDDDNRKDEEIPKTDEENPEDEQETETGEENPEDGQISEPNEENPEDGQESETDEGNPEDIQESETGEDKAEIEKEPASGEAKEVQSTQESVTVHMKEYYSKPDYTVRTETLSIDDSEDMYDVADDRQEVAEGLAADEKPASDEKSDADESEEDRIADEELTEGNETAEIIQTTTIEGIIWVSTPEYDSDIAGYYVFMPILPDDYILKEGVELPEILVTVGEEEYELPMAEAPLLAESAPSPGVISSNTTWSEGSLANCTLTVQNGVTLTITGAVTLLGKVTITGGGTIARGSEDAYFLLSSRANVDLNNITLDGKNMSANYPMIKAPFSSTRAELNEGCIIQNCVSIEPAYGGGAIYNNASLFINGATIKNCSASSTSGGGGGIYNIGNITIDDAIIEDCSTPNRGGAIISFGDMTINGGIFIRNKTTTTDNIYGLVGGGFIYTCGASLTVNGGSFIGNTAANKGGCIYHCGHKNTKTYLYGGYYEGNTCTYPKYQGSGGVYNSIAALDDTDLYLAGNIHFVGGADLASGTDGIYLDYTGNVLRKIWIKDEFDYPITIYVDAVEGYIIAEGYDYTILENRDMKKIYFVNMGNGGEQWYPVLDKTTNQVRLSTTKPSYMDKYFVNYNSNGAKGKVKDDNNNDEGYEKDTIVTVMPGYDLSMEYHAFEKWNTKADGSGDSYYPGDELVITDDIDLYAIFTSNAAEYQIQHYMQNLDGNGYTKLETDTRKIMGVIDSDVKAIPNKYLGFTENKTYELRNDSGVVAEDGSLVLRLYYDRNKYKVNFNLNYDGDNIGSIPESQSILYGNPIHTVTGPTRKGYHFAGWYTDTAGSEGNEWDFGDNVEKITAESKQEQSATLYAKWVDDIDPLFEEISHNAVKNNLRRWLVGKNDLIITVPIIEEGSGVDKLIYTLIPTNGEAISGEAENEGIVNGEVQAETAYLPRQIQNSNATAQLCEENGQIVARITIAEDYEGRLSLICTDKAGNRSAEKIISAEGGIIVEDNAPQIDISVQNQKNHKREVKVSVYDTILEQENTDDKTISNVFENDNEEVEGDSYITCGIANIAYHIDDDEKAITEHDIENPQYASEYKENMLLSCEFNIEVTGVGNHTLYVTAIDNAGNETKKKVDIKITSQKSKTVITSTSTGSDAADTNETSGEFTTFIKLVQPKPSGHKEPRTGDASVLVEIYATLAMISGLFYILLYFSTGENGMTEAEKNAFVSKIIGWAKRGSSFRKPIAIATIFWVLCYYHSIGKRVQVEWNRVYEK